MGFSLIYLAAFLSQPAPSSVAFIDTTPLPGRGAVQRLAFSADASRLLAAGNSITVYDTATGNLLWSAPHERIVEDAVFSADGKSVVLIQDRPAVLEVWDAVTGERRAAYRLADSVWQAALSPAGFLIATVFSDAVDVSGYRLIIVDTNTGKTLLTPVEAHPELMFFHVSITVQGTRALYCDRQSVTHILALPSGEQLGLLDAAEALTMCPYLVRDGGPLVVNAYESIEMIDLKSRAVLATIPAESGVPRGVHQGGAGPTVLLADHHALILYDVKKRKVARRLEVAEGVSQSAISADGHRIAATTRSGDLVVWNADTGKQLVKRDAARVLHLLVDAHGSEAALVFADGSYRLLDVDTRTSRAGARALWHGEPPPMALDGRYLPKVVVARRTGARTDLVVIDLHAKEPERALPWTGPPVRMLAWVGATALLVADADKQCTLLELDSGKVRFKDVCGTPNAAAATDAALLLGTGVTETTAGRGSVSVRDPHDGKRAWVATGNEGTGPVTAVTLSPDGALAIAVRGNELLAFATKDGAKLWRSECAIPLDDGDERCGHGGFTFTEGGRSVIDARNDRQGIAWLDAATGALSGRMSLPWAGAELGEVAVGGGKLLYVVDDQVVALHDLSARTPAPPR